MIEPMNATEEQNAGQTMSRRSLVDNYKDGLPDALGHLIFWPIAIVGLALDLWSKHAVFADLIKRPEQSLTIIKGFLTFRMALNDGAAFGLAGGRQVFLISVSAVALMVILGVFFFGSARQRLVQVALGLFAAGVCGNLWDRAFNHGEVRDFIDVVYWPGRHWHTFNVADALLCVAVGLLISGTLLTGSSGQKRDRQQK